MRKGSGKSSLFRRWSVFFFGIFISFLAAQVQSYTVKAQLPEEVVDRFAENNIIYYDPCDGFSGGGNKKTTAEGACAKLGEMRTKMWEAASQETSDATDFETVEPARVDNEKHLSCGFTERRF